MSQSAEDDEELARQCDEERASLLKLAAQLEERASTHRRWAREKREGTKGSLTGKLTPVNVNRPVTNEHRMNIARGQKPDDKAFSRALAEQNFTQKRLAVHLRITPALLSMYRMGKRPIPQERAEKVEALTGWKATARNWPGGIV